MKIVVTRPGGDLKEYERARKFRAVLLMWWPMGVARAWTNRLKIVAHVRAGETYRRTDLIDHVRRGAMVFVRNMNTVVGADADLRFWYRVDVKRVP